MEAWHVKQDRDGNDIYIDHGGMACTQDRGNDIYIDHGGMACKQDREVMIFT